MPSDNIAELRVKNAAMNFEMAIKILASMAAIIARLEPPVDMVLSLFFAKV